MFTRNTSSSNYSRCQHAFRAGRIGFLATVFTGIQFFPLASGVLAQTVVPGLVIENQATGSYVDPTDSTSYDIESNVVQVTVAEVAGVTLTPAGFQEVPAITGDPVTQDNGTFEANDEVYFLFTATNVGNDPTQFFIPGAPSTLTNATQSGQIEIIEVDPDGPTGATAPTDFSNIPVTIQSVGNNTGDATALGLPVGALPAGGTLTLRVPVKLNSGLGVNDAVDITLGNVGPNDNSAATQNQDYEADGSNLDFYTQDNKDSDGITDEANGAPLNGDTTLHRKEASASRTLTLTLPGADPDFGDAPDIGVGNAFGNYDTTLASNGPSHRIVPGVYLGASEPDGEADALQSGLAQGDDTTGLADEDGVLLGGSTLQGQTITPGDVVTLTINTDSNDSGVLNAWFDWNSDGDFTDSGEQVATDVVPSGGVISLPFTVGASVTGFSGTTFARFRYSSDTGLLPTGSATDGEVEDYAVSIGVSNKDYGDAPDSDSDTGFFNYNTLLSSDGPRHIVTPGLSIGTAPDAESDALVHPSADGDDQNGADEGGISVGSLLTTDTSHSIDNIDVTNITGQDAYLVGWIDFNRNGIFNTDEAATVLVPTGGSTTVSLNWNSLSNLQSGGAFARFRLTTDSTIATGDALTSVPTGLASDGEVEDYPFSIAQPLEGDACSNPYGEVFAGQGDDIFALHSPTGTAFLLTDNALSSPTNSLASDHVNNLVFYTNQAATTEAAAIYAYDTINDIHFQLEDFNGQTDVKLMSGGGNIASLVSGGAGFYGGSYYVGVENFQDNSNSGVEIYRVDFVPGSNNRTIQSLTALGVNDSTDGANGALNNADWGDLILDDNGLIYGSTTRAGYTWSFDPSTGTYTQISSTYLGQLAKDGLGQIWGLSSSQIQRVDLASGTNSGSPNPTIGAADLAECAGGLSAIGDFIWDDLNGNGIQESGEPGIGNVTVAIYRDLDGDGQIDSTGVSSTDDPLLTSVTTDSDGYYVFPGLLFGDYIVEVTDTNSVLTGSTLTTGSVTHAVNLPTGISFYLEADFGYTLPVVTADSPSVLLVKRITAVNGQTINPNDNTNLSTYVDGGDPNDEDNHPNWPEGADVDLNPDLYGAITGGVVKSDDEVEYTIYFLSTGEEPASNVVFCDRIPDGQTFVPNSTFLNLTPGATPSDDGLLGEDRGILVSYDGSNTTYTNIGGDDTARFYPPESGLPPACNLLNNQFEHNGAVVVDLGDLPNATSSGVPNDSYGFVRFRATVTE